MKKYFLILLVLLFSLCFSTEPPFLATESTYGNKSIAIISYHNYPLIRFFEKGDYKSIKERADNTVLLLNQHIKGPNDVSKLSLSITQNIYSIKVENQNIFSIYPEEIQFYGLPIIYLLKNWISKMNRIDTILKNELTSSTINNETEEIKAKEKPVKTEQKEKKQKPPATKKPANSMPLKNMVLIIIGIIIVTLILLFIAYKFLRKNKKPAPIHEEINNPIQFDLETEPVPEETAEINEPSKLTEAELEARIAAATSNRNEKQKKEVVKNEATEELVLSQDEMNLFLVTTETPIKEISPLEAALKEDLAAEKNIFQDDVMADTKTTIKEKAIKLSKLKLSYEKIAKLLGISMIEVDELLKVDPIEINIATNSEVTPSSASLNLPEDMDPDLKEELTRILSNTDYSLYDKTFQMASIGLSTDEVATYLDIDPKSVAPLLKEGEASGVIPTPKLPIEDINPTDTDTPICDQLNLPDDMDPDLKEELTRIVSNTDYSLYDKAFQMASICLSNDEIASYLSIDPKEVAPLLKEGEASGTIPTPQAPIETTNPSSASLNLPEDMDEDLKEELTRILSNSEYSLYDKAFQMASICLSNDEIASYLSIDPKEVAPLLKEGEASGAIPTPQAPIETIEIDIDMGIPELSSELIKKRDDIINNSSLKKSEKVIQLTALKIDRVDIAKYLNMDDLEIEMILQ